MAVADSVHGQQRTVTSFSKPFSSSPPSDPPLGNALRPSSRQQANGASKFSHAATHLVSRQQDVPDEVTVTSKLPPTSDPNYLAPYKNSGGRAPQANISRSGSEADSLLDLYGRPKSTVDSIETREKTPPHPAPPEALYFDEDPESSKWVHRDKLAIIESNELQEAGIELPRHSSLRGGRNSKSNSRRGHSRAHSRQQSASGDHEQESGKPLTREGKRQRVRTPVWQEETPDNALDFNLGTPEEIAANPHDSSSSSMYRQQGLRSSSSRIPLPTSSPMPIPQEHRERHTPLPRTRGASGSWDEEGLVYSKPRPRSQSAGSQILLHHRESLNSTPTPAANVAQASSPSTSPSKQRAISKPVQSSNARKASTALRNVSEPSKTRSTSANSRASPATRPKSRSGLEPRPATAINRPEGEAPWLATMYKPDPRLPPEQQLLPTHAKRLQQKQSEEQARAAGIEPRRLREFSPVAVHTHNGLQPPSPITTMSPRDGNEKSPAENQPGWPLKASPKPSASNLNGGRGGGSPGGASDHAGYTTMPKVQTTPPTGSTPGSRPMVHQPSRRQSGRQHLQEKEGQKEKGCGCCVIM